MYYTIKNNWYVCGHNGVYGNLPTVKSLSTSSGQFGHDRNRGPKGRQRLCSDSHIRLSYQTIQMNGQKLNASFKTVLHTDFVYGYDRICG